MPISNARIDEKNHYIVAPVCYDQRSSSIGEPIASHAALRQRSRSYLAERAKLSGQRFIPVAQSGGRPALP